MLRIPTDGIRSPLTVAQKQELIRRAAEILLSATGQDLRQIVWVPFASTAANGRDDGGQEPNPITKLTPVH